MSKEKELPKYPYVHFKVKRQYVVTGGSLDEREDDTYLNIDTVFGTQDHVLHYSKKPNFTLVGCANLDPKNPEHQKISAFIDQVAKGVAAAQKTAEGIVAKAKSKGVVVDG